MQLSAKYATDHGRQRMFVERSDSSCRQRQPHKTPRFDVENSFLLNVRLERLFGLDVGVRNFMSHDTLFIG